MIGWSDTRIFATKTYVQCQPITPVAGASSMAVRAFGCNYVAIEVDAIEKAIEFYINAAF